MKTIPFFQTKLEGFFWGEKQRVIRTVTLDAIYDRFCESKRFEALKCDADQQKKEGWRPHIFWDSDAAKWIEGLAYVLEQDRSERLEAKADEMIEDMCRSQREDGYYNCYYNVYAPDKRFTIRGDHELYCLGHLIEAAIAYRHATGKDRLFGLVERYTDLVIRVFEEEGSAAFMTPGHEEIELALVKLYRETQKEKYLKLASFFVERRGRNDKDPAGYYPWATARYAQDHLPVRKQRTAEGHAVRAMYLYMAMADLALETGDESLYRACDAILHNAAGKRMYITGGIGSSHLGEAFTVDYDLPNEKAYTETCATLALALFCRRMSAIRPVSFYGDTAERAMYNGSLAGISIGGDEFFYENPLTVDLKNHQKNPSTKEQERYPITQRLKVFSCSCCPPNILRFIGSIADFLYTEEAETLFVHHFMNGATSREGRTVRQITAYPADGKVKIEVSGYRTIAVRVPGWCTDFSASAEYRIKDGYAYFENEAVLDLDFYMTPRFAVSSPDVHENAGRAVLTYGPLVYCAEGVDNEGDLFAYSVDVKSEIKAAFDRFFGLPVFTADGYVRVDGGLLYADVDTVSYEKKPMRFIPYFGMENRGETDMAVWIPTKG